MKTSILTKTLLGAGLSMVAAVGGIAWESSNSNAVPTPSASSSPATLNSAATAPAPDVSSRSIPVNILPNTPLGQVIRLTQAGVDQNIIRTYVTNSSGTFNLDSDKIIYLSDLGVPSDLVTTMMRRDAQLQQQFAASQAAQSVPSPQPAAAPDNSTAYATEVASQPAEEVTVDYFNDTLSPYGNWVEVAGYGRCWRPTTVNYDPGWQPYCDHGHWVYTDCGWYWASDYAWGSTFHYGRWFRDARAGWCWWPDTAWAPSWVTWRYDDSYCGWAPLPPFAVYQTGVGFTYRGSGVSVSFGFGLDAGCFTFVQREHFCDYRPRDYCARPTQVVQIYNNTTIINNINIHERTIHNTGISADSIAIATHHPIRPVPVNQVIDGNNGHHPGTSVVVGENNPRHRNDFGGHDNTSSHPGQNSGAQGNSHRNTPSAENQSIGQSPVPVIAARNPLDHSHAANPGHQNSTFRTYSPEATPAPVAGTSEHNAPQYSQSFPASESPRSSNHDSDSRPMANHPAHSERPAPTRDFSYVAPQNSAANLPQHIQEQPHYQAPQRDNPHISESRQEAAPQRVVRDNSSDQSSSSHQNNGGQDQSDRGQNHGRH